MNYIVTIALLFAATQVAASTPAEGVTRVEILAADGVTVVAQQDSGYAFTLAEGSYTLRASLLDVNGNAIVPAFTQAFAVSADVATRTVQTPAGASLSITVAPAAPAAPAAA